MSKKTEDLIDRVAAGESVAEVVDEITTTSSFPMRPPQPMGLVRPRRIKKEKGQGELPYIGFREPISAPGPTYHRSYEGVSAEPSAVLAAKTKTAPPFSRQDPEGNPWQRALRCKRYRGLVVGFGKSRAMGEKKKGHMSGGEPQKKPDHLKAKLSEVGLAKDSKGYFVYTHRYRSKSYKSPDAIPDKEIKFTAETG